MALRQPIVRHFIACEDVQRSASGHYSLVDIVHGIRAAAPYPRIHPRITLFVMMTDGDGTHEFWVEWVLFAAGQQQSLWSTKHVKLDLGSDPTQVQGWTIRLRNVWLPQPGDYQFVLWCDGDILAREAIRAW
jgi:hypothetical protein